MRAYVCVCTHVCAFSCDKVWASGFPARAMAGPCPCFPRAQAPHLCAHLREAAGDEIQVNRLSTAGGKSFRVGAEPGSEAL